MVSQGIILDNFTQRLLDPSLPSKESNTVVFPVYKHILSPCARFFTAIAAFSLHIISTNMLIIIHFSKQQIIRVHFATQLSKFKTKFANGALADRDITDKSDSLIGNHNDNFHLVLFLFSQNQGSAVLFCSLSASCSFLSFSYLVAFLSMLARNNTYQLLANVILVHDLNQRVLFLKYFKHYFDFFIRGILFRLFFILPILS